MKDPKRGHTPKLVNAVSKMEWCSACGALRKRGEKWARPCPGKGAG